MKKLLSSLVLCIGILILSLPVQARKVSGKLGAFAFNAKSATKSGSLSGLGAYQMEIRQELGDHLELGIGYTLVMSNTVGGDLGFGLDLGLIYFPFSRLGPQKSNFNNTHFFVQELWRPYVGLGFVERRFQSVEASYAGYSLIMGTERQLSYSDFSLVIEIRVSSMSGRSGSTASENLLTTGILFPF